MKTRLDVYESGYKNTYCFEYRDEWGRIDTSVLYVCNDKEMKLYIDCFKDRADIIETCFDGKFNRIK